MTGRVHLRSVSVALIVGMLTGCTIKAGGDYKIDIEIFGRSPKPTPTKACEQRGSAECPEEAP
jgi:hypothetical protein